jgi:hypothetical protein
MKPPTTSCQNYHPSSPCSPASAMANLVGLRAQDLPWLRASSHRLSRHGAQHRLHHNTTPSPAKPFSCSADRQRHRPRSPDENPVRTIRSSVLASNGGVGWRWQAGRLGFGIQDTTAAFGAAPLRVLERPNLGHLHFRTRRLKTRGRPFGRMSCSLCLLISPPVARSVAHSGTV